VSIYLSIRFDSARHLAKFDIRTSQMLLRNWYPLTDASAWLLYASLVLLSIGLAMRLVFMAPDAIPMILDLVKDLEAALK
jgi:TRAP-type C4-dicarboxylate transport system permease small subunit